jgi:hypothetical protein
MVLDVLLIRDVDAATKAAHADYPPDWPIRCIERADESPAPATPWIRMSVLEYQIYRDTEPRKSAADAASRARKDAGPAPPSAEERIAALEASVTELETKVLP